MDWNDLRFDGDSDKRLKRVGAPERRFVRDVWLLTLPDLRHTSRVRAFMDHMEEHVRTIQAQWDAAHPEEAR